MDEKSIEIVRKWALDNARKYEGKANHGAVVGKILAEMPELKAKLKEAMLEIQQIITDVNSLSVEEQIAELEKTDPELLEEKKIVQEKVLKDLPDVEGKVILRAAPSASGPLHIGHALAFSLSVEYAKKYNGKVVLRIEDTNPENVHPDAYELISEDFKWLAGDTVSETVIQSDQLETYYDLCHDIISKDGAYVCTCNADTFRELISKKQACPCRDLDVKEHLLRWDKMFVEFEPGQAVVRIKTNIEDSNPAMRDWPAFRINHHEHPRQGAKYKVWPLMNFSVSVDDHELGITHSIRGKDHMDNAKRQAHIFDIYGWKKPHHSYFGLINFVGLVLSTSETRKQIDYGEFSGWDDIRLPFLQALRRRGYQPEAFHKFAVEMGINMNDKKIEAEDFFKNLDFLNREVIEPLANRYFFVHDPVKIDVKNAPDVEAKAPLHPDDESRGSRLLKTSGAFYITKEDEAGICKGLCRLMHCMNVKKEGSDIMFDSKEADKYREEGKSIIHWLPVDDVVDVEVVMPDGSVKEGVGESSLKDLDIGSIIQFERFGFCRLDKKEDKLTFWFTHK